MAGLIASLPPTEEKGRNMENRVAVIGIIVEDKASVPQLNTLLSEYGEYIIGRMGIPYRARGVNIICIAIDAPTEKIDALTASLSGIDGIRAQATYSHL